MLELKYLLLIFFGIAVAWFAYVFLLTVGSTSAPATTIVASNSSTTIRAATSSSTSTVRTTIPTTTASSSSVSSTTSTASTTTTISQVPYILYNVSVGTSPDAVAFNPQGTQAYVVNQGGTVSVISVATGNVIGNITVGTTPTSVAFNPQGTLAYITNSGGYTVSVINVTTGTLSTTVPVQQKPFDIAFNPQGTAAYVTAWAGNISVVNTTTNIVVNSISVYGCGGIAFNPPKSLIYATNVGSGGVVDIINASTNTLEKTVAVGAYPTSVTFNPAGTFAYVANSGGFNVSVINTTSGILVRNIPLPYGIGYPESIVIDPRGKFAYVAAGTGSVVIINLTTNTTTSIKGFSKPYGIAINPQGTIAYVTDFNKNRVIAIAV